MCCVTDICHHSLPWSANICLTYFDLLHRSEQYARLKELFEFQQKLVELRLCTTDGRSWDVELHQNSTLRVAVELARSALPPSPALERADDGGVHDPYREAGGGVEWRLRHFSPMTGRAGQTFATNLLDSSLVRIYSLQSKQLGVHCLPHVL